mgnify:CR=1 FL=1
MQVERPFVCAAGRWLQNGCTVGQVHRPGVVHKLARACWAAIPVVVGYGTVIRALEILVPVLVCNANAAGGAMPLVVA